METALFLQNNKIGLLMLSGIIFMFAAGTILLLFFHFSQKKFIQQELEKKDLELQHNKLLLNATLEVQEKERKRIAQDLHDDISSKLNIISINSHLLSIGGLTKEKQDEVTGIIIGLSSKVLENSRRIAHNLFPPVFDKFGIHAAILELCKEFNTLENVNITYENTIEFDPAESEKHMHVFRILQELLNNSIRHGKATNISIRFDGDAALTTCHYKDNGLGFDTESSDNKKGLGMKNIESRINYLKGSFDIQSVINQGTTITFTF
ncbi:sensor histidine kinase [Flavobacterium psychrotrophum]|uniref:sensor histidine kinase n=1 Tax=Flavobacterium psychrotrophum TaxID=2294119 RepID=UPI001F09CB6E|nr:ATP-binding protein [Flavobacterium psychrotrophum]